MTTDHEGTSLPSTMTAVPDMLPVGPGTPDVQGSPAAQPPVSEDPTALLILEAQEQERARLAEELHDGPAQALANAIFRLEIVDRALRSQPAVAAKALRALRA